ncbi:winged helix-turn-helix domain-containing protein [Streptomyces roseirectus]|uniref:Winged helix-turn-helix domain-containing protein n=1 Tax=Streptomyces roseirectus TaxID=2768066 RepID=A0A7H0IPZ8_9ACTN|nr:BTAD domain-containing putative transcriptional regulator [Streptomyces roseirectus]QNP74864.1 winged helix-turn-helix domain-containing protein [Streptomyces roseirectus]
MRIPDIEVSAPDFSFTLLGPLEVVGADGETCLLPGRQRAALSVLLIRAGRVASIGQLVDAIWEEVPPQTARAQVQFCVHALRRVLDDLAVPARIVTQPPGYRLEVPDDRLDSRVFERHVDTARALAAAGRAEDAATAFRRGLDLWRGPALDGAGRAVRDQVVWLDELRAQAREQCVELELGLGRHRELVGPLRTFLAADPLAEGLRGQLMLALYRSGMKGEALNVYRAGRTLSAEQLGLDPGERLRGLQAAILADDPGLLWTPGERAAGAGERGMGPGERAAGPGDRAMGPEGRLMEPGERVAGPGGRVAGPEGWLMGPGERAAGLEGRLMGPGERAAGLDGRLMEPGESGEPAGRFAGRPGPSRATAAPAYTDDSTYTDDPTLPWRPRRPAPLTPGRSAHHRPPRQLPAAIPDFTGHTALVAELVRELGSAREPAAGPRIVNITGGAGVGKSALAVHVAHRVAAAFPDGQLYVDLTDVRPPGAALAQTLVGFGYDAGSLAGDAANAALYRSLLAGRRFLVLLEGARDEQDVALLLPGSADGVVLVTSRRRLTGLPGARFAHVDPLTGTEAAELLERLTGGGGREPDAVAALVDLTGGLPLALRIVGARLRARPHWTLRTMVRHLEEEAHRLDLLTHGELSVRDSLLSVYTDLGPDEARLLRRLGALSGRRLPRWTAAAVLGEGRRCADELLERLADAGLLDTSTASPADAGHFHRTELVRLFSAERLRADEPGAEPGVLRQILEGWLCLAEHARRAVRAPHAPAPSPATASWRVHADAVADALTDPTAWLLREREGMSAALARGRELGLEELCGALTRTVSSLWTDLREGAESERARRSGPRAVSPAVGWTA